MVAISPIRCLSAGLLLSCSAAVLLVLGSGCGSDSGAPSSPSTPATSSSSTDSGTPADTSTSTTEATDTDKDDVDPPAEGGNGSLTGVVKLTGTWTAPAPLFAQGDTTVKDAAVCAHDGIPDDSLVVNPDADNGVANVFVYLSKAPKDFEQPEAEKVVMDQKGCTFVPRALIVQAGQAIQVKSSDAVSHNVHTFPVASSPFNSICPPNDQEGLALVYDRGERVPVSVKCDIHPWMQAWHLPLDHPFAAVTDADGKFTIENIPAGSHTFRVWQEKVGFVEKSLKVTIKADEATEVTIPVGPDQLAGQPGPHRTIVLNVAR